MSELGRSGSSREGQKNVYGFGNKVGTEGGLMENGRVLKEKGKKELVVQSWGGSARRWVRTQNRWGISHSKKKRKTLGVRTGANYLEEHWPGGALSKSAKLRKKVNFLQAGFRGGRGTIPKVKCQTLEVCYAIPRVAWVAKLKT